MAKAEDVDSIVDDEDGHTDPCMLFEPALEDDGVIEEALRPWRPANSLISLRAAINAAYPGRSTKSDGIVGDAAHQSRASDHNPWVTDGARGVVTAIDITHDPASGCDAGRIVEALRASRDKRIKYLIWNRRIANASAIGGVAPWTWRSYTGKNPHDHHFHLSVKPDKAFYDDESVWTVQRMEEALGDGPAADTDTDILRALEALGASIDPDAPALPQLDAIQDALTQLQANHHAVWPRAEIEGVAAEAPAFSFETLKAGYETLFARARILDNWKGTVAWYVAKIRKGRARYEAVAEKSGVPWWFIAIVHGMEASFSFTGHLHNGDPLAARTVQVPKGRPKVWNPPSDWNSSALDALEIEGFFHQPDWSLARVLYRFEGFNGYGYHALGINSPYLWSFSDQWTKGKFVADHKFDPNAASKQCGAAVMLRALVDAGDVQI
ncbi:hypothetical protein ACFFJ7_19450 [Pseudochelatococcus lubricantis]|uniref:hypothetical protein n=1 Tax=Pseudochelatococcus lubricantis TaxID=1538102 RepID=UPI0035EBEC72